MSLGVANAQCACGCGYPVGAGRRYVSGHNLLGMPRTEAWKRAIGDAQRRAWATPQRRAIPQPFTGRHHSAETRAKLSVPRGPNPKLVGPRNGMYGRIGASNPNWKGGVVKPGSRHNVLAQAAGKEWVRAIYRRDGYACVNCGSGRDGAKSLHAHHVWSWRRYPELRLDLANGITLCRGCHHWVHSKQNEEREWLAG